MLPRLPLVVVEWADAWIKESPVTLEDVGATHAPTVVTTIGWVLKQDAVGISLANEWYDDTYRGRTFIPAGMILKVTPYNLAKPRKARHGPTFTTINIDLDGPQPDGKP